MSSPSDNSKSKTNKRTSKPVKEGFLEKRGKFVTSWRTRYFVLFQQKGGLLFYFLSKFDSLEGKILGVISIKGASVNKSEQFLSKKKSFCFEVAAPLQQRTWYLNCNSEKEREEWINAIKKVATSAPVDSLTKELAIGSPPGSHLFENASINSLIDHHLMSTSAPVSINFGEVIERDRSHTAPKISPRGRQRRNAESLTIQVDETFASLANKGNPSQLFVSIGFPLRKDGKYFATDILNKKTVLVQHIKINEINKVELHMRMINNRFYNHEFATSIDFYIQDNTLWVVEDYYGLSLRSLGDNARLPLSEEALGYLCKCILLALMYMHHVGIVHNYVKRKSVFLTRNGGVKLSRAIESGIDLTNPSIIIEADATPADDILSFGTLLDNLVVNTSTEFLDFVSKCTNPDPHERATAELLFQHPFIGKACSPSKFEEELRIHFEREMEPPSLIDCAIHEILSSHLPYQSHPRIPSHLKDKINDLSTKFSKVRSKSLLPFM